MFISGIDIKCKRIDRNPNDGAHSALLLGIRGHVPRPRAHMHALFLDTFNH